MILRTRLIDVVARAACVILVCSAHSFAAEPRRSDQDGAPPQIPNANSYAGIRVVDELTGVGVPLVEMVTVNQLRFVTDSAGLVAFHEPGLLDREVFFTVRSHGYEMKKDGFGFAGVRIIPKEGKVTEIRIARRNIAERLCRLTGEGRYRDTLLLGQKPPFVESASGGLVAGQDSVQAVPYKGQIYWFSMSQPTILISRASFGSRSSSKMRRLPL